MRNIIGLNKHARRLAKAASPSGLELVGKALFVGADNMRAYAHQKISEGSVSGKGHTPSKPGAFPMRDTGVLQGGLESERTGKLEAEFRSTTPYARELEFGTSKMQARPHMKPTRDAKEREVRDLVAKAINKATGG